ncbi:MAG TPA: DUF4337 domain-containing protein [Geothrix sp.]|uniref:DUF4337 domain-containing protein n=1 Tax=Geothrix mesophila TaxID=2922723 RepID=UPI001FAD1DEC|nr:DUF4337 domain-containing protein [Geothrix sp. SG198]HJV38553.1 DUF4337 domain-containing protein [Geothrix sp.]
MSDDKKEPWLNLLALTTVILAVCATLATFKGGGHSTRAVLSQSQASDQWAYYQAKGIKGNLYEVEAMRLRRELELAPKTALPTLQKSLADVEKKVAKYDGEKAEIQKEARRFEDVKTEAQRHGAAFGLAVIFLQIGILLSSIAALLKQKPVYYLGLLVGVVGIVYFINGFYLFLGA